MFNLIEIKINKELLTYYYKELVKLIIRKSAYKGYLFVYDIFYNQSRFDLEVKYDPVGFKDYKKKDYDLMLLDFKAYLSNGSLKKYKEVKVNYKNTLLRTALCLNQ